MSKSEAKLEHLDACLQKDSMFKAQFRDALSIPEPAYPVTGEAEYLGPVDSFKISPGDFVYGDDRAIFELACLTGMLDHLKLEETEEGWTVVRGVKRSWYEKRVSACGPRGSLRRR